MEQRSHFSSQTSIHFFCTKFRGCQNRHAHKELGEYESYGEHFRLNFKNGNIGFPHPISDEETVTFTTSDGEWTSKGKYEFKLAHRTYCRQCDSHDAASAVYSARIVEHEKGIAKEIEVRGEADCGMAYCRICKPMYICSLTARPVQ